jgi:hypothetical protein
MRYIILTVILLSIVLIFYLFHNYLSNFYIPSYSDTNKINIEKQTKKQIQQIQENVNNYNQSVDEIP